MARTKYPTAAIYGITVKPSFQRLHQIGTIQEVNRLMLDIVQGIPNVHQIDTYHALLGADGQPIRENYIEDGLHLSVRGYVAWAKAIREGLSLK
jgi:lysophospholipase L1-like esterase